jgi:hypothetical protein
VGGTFYEGEVLKLIVPLKTLVSCQNLGLRPHGIRSSRKGDSSNQILLDLITLDPIPRGIKIQGTRFCRDLDLVESKPTKPDTFWNAELQCLDRKAVFIGS